MQFDWEGLKSAIKKNPEGHEKLTGRYYVTERGIEFVNAGQPKPIGAVRIPSLTDGYKVTDQQLPNDLLAELLAQQFMTERRQSGGQSNMVHRLHQQ